MMVLLSSERLHHVACKHLYYVFVLISLLEEGEGADEYFARIERWDALHADLAKWLLDEAYAVLDQISLTRRGFERLYETYDVHINYLLYRWSNQWLVAAQAFVEHTPMVSKGAWLYFLYAAWNRHCLQAFDQLLNEPRLRDTPWYTRYQEQSSQFQQLIALLQAERPVLEDIPAVQRAAVQAVQDDLERLAETLAQEWREAVEWATEGLPWEQLETALDRPDASPPPAYDDDSIPW